MIHLTRGPDPKPPEETRVVVAMSGGVDSSVTAALLKQAGFDLIGITMQLWPSDLPVEQGESGCCSLSAVEDARRVANKLDIPYYVLNFQEPFSDAVISTFADRYMAGETPNPCILCNQRVKFGTLLRKALELEADYVATGHYARVGYDPSRGRYVVARSADPHKDQTYTMYGLTQEQLQHTLTPSGDYSKDEIRALARDLGFGVADKPDSQEICFIPDNDYKRFLRDYVPEAHRPGPIVDMAGNRLGEHDGIAFYTIGQRKGLGLAAGEPLYVVDIDPHHNVITVGREADVYGTGLLAREVNWVAQPGLQGPMDVTAKIRYGSQDAPAVIEPPGADADADAAEEDPDAAADTGAITWFTKPQRAISPGQAIVWYDGDVVAGGGVIARRLGRQKDRGTSAPAAVESTRS